VDDDANQILILTDLTRRAAESRRSSILGYDVPRIGVITFLVMLPAAVAVTVLAVMLLGPWGAPAFLIVEGLGFWMVTSRSRAGVRRYKSALAKRRALTDQVLLGGQPIDFATLSTPYTLRIASIPVGAPTDLEDIR
jgi:hypothetical protein